MTDEVDVAGRVERPPVVRAATDSDAARTRRAWPVVWVLMTVYAVNILDRQIMSMLGNKISLDLGLNDSQLGLLGGLGFSAVYFLFALPWGWIADRPHASRLWVISGALAVWSSMTAFCGLAQSFGQLLLGRMGVAAGEAGCVAPAQSLIAEAVPRAHLARALAVFSLGVPLGSFVGRALGGGLSDAVGWRNTFFFVGAPGLLLAVLLLLVFKDGGPRALQPTVPRLREPTFRKAIGQILRSRTIIYIALGNVLTSALNAGMGFWGMMHFQRNLGLTAGETGLWLGLQGGLTGLLGTVLGGWVADRFGAQQPRHYMTPAVVGMLVAPPLLLLTWSTNIWWAAILLMAIPAMSDNLTYGGAGAAKQRLLTSDVRASATAMVSMITILVGSGGGVTLLGLASDVVRSHLPATAAPHESIRYVLMGSAFLFVLPAFFYWRAGHHVESELARFERA